VRRGVAAAVTVGVIAVGVAASVPILTRDAAEDVPVEVVVRGPFAREVHADGVLAAEQATVLSAPATLRRGVKIAWLADDGTRVSEGDVVVRFDPTEMESQLYDGRAERATVEGNQEKTRVLETVALDNLERDATLASVELDYADAFQAKDAQIFSRIEIIESRIDRDLATHRRDHALELHDIRSDLMEVELDLLDLERSKAELQIEEAEEGLSELEIRAPHDGIFVLRRDWGETPAIGEVVWRGQPVAEIPQLDRMKADVFVLEADAGGLEPGAPAVVVLEAHPGLEFGGEVRTVAALAKRRSRWSPVQYFAVEIALHETDREVMKPGQRVRAMIRLERRDDVLTVSRDAVFEGDDGERFVWRRAGGRFERAPVGLGSSALGRVVVESGLDEGDRIALLDPSTSFDESTWVDTDAGDGTSVLPGALP
jgi:multidrug efflux pump subunit AcrA (membrane-fusion protein)